MGKAVFIIGLTIMIVAGGALVLGFVNVLPAIITQDPPADSSSKTSNATFTSSPTVIPLFTTLDQVSYNPIYNEIKVEMFFSPNVETDLTITVIITENTGAKLEVDKSVHVLAGIQKNVVFSIYAVEVFPALIGPSYQKSGDTINVELSVVNDGSGSVSVTYIAKAGLYWKIFLPISIILAVIGVVVLIIAFATKSKGPKVGKPLKYQSAVFEPTLINSAQQFGGRSSSGKKSKDKKPKQSKPVQRTRSTTGVSSANSCKQCSKPVPRQAQYCPHCYARQ